MTITYQLFEAGFCKHCERMTLTTGRFKQCEYPALCALINHPERGYILFDTGYTQKFYHLTKKFPASLYRRLTPVFLKKSLKEQLADKGISSEAIRYVIISHFHADHIGGLCDFPQAQFICHREAVDAIRHKKGWSALIKGFLPGLLPSDFYERLIFLENEVKLDANLAPFSLGFDVFNDGRLMAISLPGHAPGHIGLYFKSINDTFLIADSCWHQETFQTLVYPSELTYLVHHDRMAYRKTIQNLHALYQQNKAIRMIPAHCTHARREIQGNM
ncbi:Zn-dependent hydrolase GumP [Legionella longbeachae]|nr:Zn-dependent hydrolase, including glyoxylase [Legionella oakridgensis RV-2-2007]KTD43472.1 Zn-dependent hydrolase GumP [Legionella oakridgensis]STY20464.1 Zn-dependent hydrolase GumP [Legionella longbeachae]